MFRWVSMRKFRFLAGRIIPHEPIENQSFGKATGSYFTAAVALPKLRFSLGSCGIMRPARNLIFLTDTHRNILKTFVQLFFSDLQYFLKYDAFKFSPDEDYCHARWSLPNLQQITQWSPLAFAWRTLLYDEVYFPYNRASITMTATALSL